MPEPIRTSTRPCTSSAMMASRTAVRLTEKRSASARSDGRRVPGGNSPSRTSSTIFSASSRYERSPFQASGEGVAALSAMCVLSDAGAW